MRQHNHSIALMLNPRTVHKSQGQTMDRVGIFFAKKVWAHGLLYVAISRVRRAADCWFVGSVGATVMNICSKNIL